MSDPIKDRLEACKYTHDDSDWREVRRRAYGRGRIVTILVIAGAVLVALLVAPGIGLGGRIIGFFSGPGNPVPLTQLASNDREMLVLMFCRRVELVVPPGKAPERHCAEGPGAPEVTQVAHNGERAYWKIVYADGRVCLANGSAHIHRSRIYGESQFGSLGCAEGANVARLLPSPEQPITSEIAEGGSIRTGEMHIFRVTGLAGDGVADVALVDADGSTVKTEPEGHMYELSSPPARNWIALVAHDARGDVVFRQPLAPGAGPAIPSRPVPPQPPLPPRPRPRRLSGDPLQHAEIDGATIDVYPGGAIIHFTSGGGPYRFLRDHLGDGDEVSVGCSKLAFGAGEWAVLGTAISGSRFGRVIQERFGLIPRADPEPPYDECSVGGHYGRRWDEHVGYHTAAEFPFNPLAERFFAERAAARRLAYFVRSPKMHEIRAGLKRGGTAPSSAEIAGRFDESVVALASRDELPPPAKVGVWSDGAQTIVAAERADDGRRMWVELNGGRLGPHDLHALAFVF